MFEGIRRALARRRAARARKENLTMRFGPYAPKIEPDLPRPYPLPTGHVPRTPPPTRIGHHRDDAPALWYPAPGGYEQTGPARFYEMPSCGKSTEPIAADPHVEVAQGPNHWHRAVDPEQGGSWSGDPSPSDSGYSGGSSTSYDSGPSSYDSGSGGGSSDSGSSSGSCD